MTITQATGKVPTARLAAVTKEAATTTTVVAPSTLAGTKEPDVHALRGRLTGELITSGHPEFDEARKVHDVTVDRRPFAIVQAANAQDVAEAVRFARQHNLPLAVRSGGHSVPKLSMIDGAVIVDFSTMKGITIDPERRTAWVPAGRDFR